MLLLTQAYDVERKLFYVRANRLSKNTSKKKNENKNKHKSMRGSSKVDLNNQIYILNSLSSSLSSEKENQYLFVWHANNENNNNVEDNC